LEDEIIYQGDGINNLLYADLPSQEIKALKSVVLSNTCDNDINNRRYLSSYINYSPLISLEKYEQTLLKTYPAKKNEISRESLKQQRIFSLSNYGFYLFLFKLSIHFTRFGEAVDRG
jgi:hypothetical protein